MEIPLSEVFEQAAKLLERDGWCQGSFTVYVDGAVQGRCVVGAVRAAIYDDSEDWGDARIQGTFSHALYALNNTLAEVTAGQSWAVTTWNDEEGRTADEAIALLHMASSIVSSTEVKA